MTLKHNSEAEFSERLEEFQVIVFYHLAILETTSPPVKTWALDMPAETFAGAPILVKFGKGIPCEISDDIDYEQDGSSHTNATSSDADPTIECATTKVGSPAQSNIDELEYFVLDHFNNDKSESEDEDWVSVSSKNFWVLSPPKLRQA
ncbi:hypothetical protein KCU93_g2921, partial [Aureobasidium melanogenum]